LRRPETPRAHRAALGERLGVTSAPPPLRREPPARGGAADRVPVPDPTVGYQVRLRDAAAAAHVSGRGGGRARHAVLEGHRPPPTPRPRGRVASPRSSGAASGFSVLVPPRWSRPSRDVHYECLRSCPYVLRPLAWTRSPRRVVSPELTTALFDACAAGCGLAAGATRLASHAGAAP